MICFILILFLNGSWFPASASAIAHVQLHAKLPQKTLGRAISLGSAAPEGKHLLLGAVLTPSDAWGCLSVGCAPVLTPCEGHLPSRWLCETRSGSSYFWEHRPAIYSLPASSTTAQITASIISRRGRRLLRHREVSVG